MILIEHSWRVLIFWNNGSTFSKPQVLTKGDLHGVAIADYDFDRLINLIVVQDGGTGSKPRNPLLYQVNKDRTIISGKQIEGLEKMRGRAVKIIDADGVLDLLLTGFPTSNQMKTGAVGSQAQTIDYDADGDQDIIYANERGNWHLFTNNSVNNNNYITVKIGASTEKKANPQGAILTIKTCNNIYNRVVGTTYSTYSQGLNTHLHISLGDCKKIKEAKVLWVNGETKTFDIKKLKTSLFVGEK